MINTNKNSNIIDMIALWPSVYTKIKDTIWFNKLATFYYEMSRQKHIKWFEKPLVIAGDFKEDDFFGKCDDIKQLNCTSPTMVQWWIYPHGCTVMNGMFLYLVLKNIDIKTQIYQSQNHTFLKDEQNQIYDMYWQPLGYCAESHMYEYNNAIINNPIDFWTDYDFIYWMKLADLL